MMRAAPRKLAIVLILSACSSRAPRQENFRDARIPASQNFTGADASRIQSILDDVRDKVWPELKAVKIGLRSFTSDSDYFRASVVLEDLPKNPLRRHYLLYVNPRVFADPPSADALFAIIAHELKHIKDYTSMKGREIVGLGALYRGFMMDEQSLRQLADYERRTDEAVLERGYSRGLKEYRQWLYAHIPESALPAKLRNYYSPDEIDEWDNQHSEPSESEQ
jgi:hypothetical protein